MAQPRGTLIRAALEHLRMAISLETRTYDILSESNLLNKHDLKGPRYVDLGAPPTAAEQRTASHMQTDEPPPMDEDERRPRRGPGLPSGPHTNELQYHPRNFKEKQHLPHSLRLHPPLLHLPL